MESDSSDTVRMYLLGWDGYRETVFGSVGAETGAGDASLQDRNQADELNQLRGKHKVTN